VHWRNCRLAKEVEAQKIATRERERRKHGNLFLHGIKHFLITSKSARIIILKEKPRPELKEKDELRS
jgi:hypothetical protein